MARPVCLRFEDYEVGWISALPVELSAAAHMLDTKHVPLPYDATDTNVYTVGSIGRHNVVMACLPVGQTGTNSAATVAARMRQKFPAMRFVLMVGIGGGVPSAEIDIRLGDVVVSQPNSGQGGVVQYDFGKSTPSGFTRTGFLNAPPTILLSALATCQAEQMAQGGSLASHPLRVDGTHFLPDCPGLDILFEGSYNHIGGTTCDTCDRNRLVTRPARKSQRPMVHYGTIGSGNQVIRDGVTRDQLSSDLGGVLCFEMEAAGVMNNLPCLVIRGVCDYADDHKNKSWQSYAALAAAAYARALLAVVPPIENLVSDICYSKPSVFNQHSISIARPPKQAVRDIVGDGGFASLGLLSDYEADRTLEQYQSRRCPGTTQWILGCGIFQRWLANIGTPCLWVTGKIGSGKTLLTSTVIELLISESYGSKTFVAHFFYSHSHASRLNGIDVFRSYIKQIINHLETTAISVPSKVLSYLRRIRSTTTSPLTFEEIIENLFVPLTQILSGVCYVIDGLDECKIEEAHKVMRVFRRILSHGKTKIFISGRESLDVTHSIPGSSVVRISNADVQEDIRDFIEWKVGEKMCERLLTENASLLQEIKSTLVDKADRMILWVSLQIDNIWDECSTDAEIRKALANLPRDLDETYDRCLNRIDPRYQTFAPSILRWICAAINPFTVTQLKEALAIDTQTGALLQDRILSTQDILRCCVNLITVDAEEKVVLAHHSVSQYLRTRAPDFILFPSGFDLGLGKKELARLCIAHLRSSTYTLAIERADANRGREIRIPGPMSMIKELPLLRQFRLPMPKPAKITIPPRTNATASHGNPPSFFYFARDQWALLTNELLESDALWSDFRALALEPNLTWRLHPWHPLGQSVDSHYCGLLGWAIANRHASMLKLLFNPEAPNIRPDIFKTPLQYYDNLLPLHLSARIGDKGIFEILLQRCDYRTTDSDNRTAMYHAAAAGSTELIRPLTAKRWKFLVQDRNGMSALHIAAKHGYWEIVRDLLLAVNLTNWERTESKQMRTALHWAAASGHTTVVEHLLVSGAKYDLADREGKRALDLAAENGFEAVVRVLWEKYAFSTVYTQRRLRASILAAQKGHEEVVKALLDDTRSNKFRKPAEATGLQLAAAEGDKELVECLLAKGANVNSQVENGYTALYAAADQGHEEIVEILLRNGANPNVQGYQGTTVISAAAEDKHLGIVKLALAHGADVNLQDTLGCTALYVAAKNGYETIVETLLQAGAEVNLHNRNGGSPLCAAARGGFKEVLLYLLQAGADLNSQEAPEGTALYVAAEVGNQNIVDLLLQKGANVNLQDQNGWTALHIAVLQGHTKVVISLVKQGANISGRTEERETAMDIAARYENHEIIELLLATSIGIMNRKADTDTAIFLKAVTEGYIGVVKSMLIMRKIGNLDEQQLKRAMDIAASKDKNEIVELLLRRSVGAALDIDITVFLKAVTGGYTGVVKNMLGKRLETGLQRFNVQTALRWASRAGENEMASVLLDQGTNVNEQDEKGQTALLVASRHGNVALIKPLIDRGADLNLQSNGGQTALLLAVVFRHQEVIEVLLAHGADINLQDDDGWTPLYAAAAAMQTTLVQLLLKHNAKCDLRNKLGETPLDIARQKGYEEIVEMLRHNAMEEDQETVSSDKDHEILPKRKGS